jgi:hypothetical protein
MARKPATQKTSETPTDPTQAAEEPSTALTRSATMDIVAAGPSPSASLASPESAEAKELRLIKSQVEDAWGRVVYSHKAQEKAADACARALRRRRILQVCIATCTTLGAFVALTGYDPAKIVTAISSIFALLSVWNKVDPAGSVNEHRTAALNYLELIEKYQSLLVSLEAGTLTVEEARERRDELHERRMSANRKAPRTDEDAYAKAEKDIKGGKTSFSRKELDKMAIPALRKDVHDDDSRNG